MTRRHLLASLAAAGGPPWSRAGRVRAEATVRSPGNRVRASVTVSPDGRPSLSIAFEQRLVLTCPRLGLDTGEPSPPVRIAAARWRTVEDAYTLHGKVSSVRERGRELEVTFAPAAAGGKAGGFRLLVRAYDDGAAFRYLLAPTVDGIDLRGEQTRFSFPHDCTCWALDLGRFDTSHEGAFLPVQLSTLGPGRLLDLPLVALTGTDGTALAIAEADLAGYPALYLGPAGDGDPAVEARLAPRPGCPDLVVQAAPGRALQSPWRVVLLGTSPGRLIESTLITTLSRPTTLVDTGWIRPGKAAWDWWSGGAGGMSDATMRRLIDFAAATNLQYLLIDAGWYPFPDAEADGTLPDVTRPVPSIDLAGLVAYGRARGIALLLWFNWRHLARQFDAAFDFLARLGIAGLKVDFFNRDDADMVAFIARLLAAAAARRLVVDLHGVGHPAGLQRTWPNLLTQEAVMGAEYNKWTTRVTSRHNVTLPFTRMLLGPMDYTPGGFRNVAPDRFRPRSNLPLVQTTRGQALAMYVVFDSPLACVADAPEAYAGQGGVDLIAAVPTTWDETRVLDGSIAEFVVVARRSGPSWFVGAMTNEDPRSVSVHLGFLAAGSWTVRVYENGDAPDRLAPVRTRSVAPVDRVTLSLARNGGGVLVLRPVSWTRSASASCQAPS